MADKMNHADSKRAEDAIRSFPDHIVFVDENGDNVTFYVIEQTRMSGMDYLLVTDQKDGDGECWIMKDISTPESPESEYEFVEDDVELDAVFRIFEELMSDSGIDITN
ncbi:MAG: DUF1292 domain-containing protein [[Clostridium] aminophilum]|uniref:DUF1292 domain-containing protein n=1 Tax=[Clostridium] aminophilum TaxID=1526 RepID=A0A1I0D4C8_9FIRM|nr:DUF1292 domain-containing protein [[Clostridium] aminophilum]MDD6196828.1 DUF1292 domain-containing protein [[Clostridium] aminophilum]SET26456.1 Protein of unknown function [[Clostridium] aminophilum]